MPKYLSRRNMIFSALFEKKHFFGPNGLTLLRAVLSLGLPFLVLRDSLSAHWAATIIFTIAAFTDLFDGILARRYQLETKAGKFIDPLADKMLTLGMLGCFAYAGYYSPWLLVPIFFREILVTFFRIGWLLDGTAAGAEKLGKIKQGFMIAAIGFALLTTHAVDYSMAALESFLRASMFLSLTIALILCLVSGVSFCRNQAALLQTPSFAKYVSAMGVGLIRFAPGTWGSALTIPLILMTAWNPFLYLSLFLFLTWGGYWAYARLERKEEDPGFVVLDEACGMFITMAGQALTPLSVLAGFFLFRLFDIWKPFPVRRLERFKGFHGVLWDDLGAGVYAWICLFVLNRFLF